MPLYERNDAPLNGYTTCKYLLLLYPGLKKENAEKLRISLLKTGQLEAEDHGGPPEEAWLVTFDSWEMYENRIKNHQQEVQKKKMEEYKELLKKYHKECKDNQEALISKLDKLIKLLEKQQAEARDRDREKRVSIG